jgi:dTDP-4-amino-4,6-dideoxygalactose transaminase
MDALEGASQDLRGPALNNRVSPTNLPEVTSIMKQIPLARPDIGEQEIQAVQEVLRSGRLSIGPKLKQFEQQIARRAGRAHGIGVSSGTSGLHLCIRALGIGPGDEVITTPFSFIATTNCILYERATPVFADIDPESYNLDPDQVQRAITPRTKAILPVEVFGNPAHFDAYQRIADEHGLFLIEDSCEALGAKLNGRPAGSFGQASVFGFYPNKQITTGEGGVIVTDDDSLARLCRGMANQGRLDPHTDVHQVLGYNYRLSELSAAVGVVQMERFDELLSRRREVAEYYNRALADVEEIHLPPCPNPGESSWFVYVIRLGDRFSAADRDRFLDAMEDRGIQCQRYFKPLHLNPAVKGAFPAPSGRHPQCERISARTLALPFYNQMTTEQMDRVVMAIKEELSGRSFTPATVEEEMQTQTQPQCVPFFRVQCLGNELLYLKEVLESGWLTTAKKANRLERRFAEIVGAEHAVAVNSCTAALHLALEALGVSPGDRVFVPTMTFTASAEVVRYLGAEPLLLDVEYGSSLLTPEILAEAIAKHPEVKTLVIVHFGGQPAPMLDQDRPGIVNLCRSNGIRIVEDAAHAFPARCKDRMIGAIGDVTCFSFYANKTITSGEGGMITTDDPEIAQRAQKMRLHGIDKDVWDRFTSTKADWEYDVIAPGFKYNLSDLNAAVGLAQLEMYDRFHKARVSCAQHYREHLADIECIDLPLVHVPLEDHAWHLFSIVLKENAPVDRNELIRQLQQCNIGTSVHYKPLHRMSYYRDRYNLCAEDYPNAERIWKGCLSLPLFPTMTQQDLRYVCENLRRILCP